MKNHFFFQLVILFFVFTALLSPAYGQWFRSTIDDSLIGAMGVCIADIDGDDTMDVAATSESEGEVFWYENDNLDWHRHLIDGSLGGAMFVRGADIDGDGDQDLVADGFLPAAVVWYENNLPEGNWTRHTIDDKLDNVEYFITADIDKDGDPDVVITTFDTGKVFWYENKNLTWIKHPIATDLIVVRNVAAGDIDGDDTLDVVVSDYQGNVVDWYRNNNAGQSWTKHTIDQNLPGAFHMVIAEIDGDNKPDVVITAKKANSVVWYKNNLPDTNWTQYTIDDNLLDCHHLAASDIDNDQDQDVIATSQGESILIWYENNYPDLIPHTIDRTLSGCRIQSAADIDNDGYQDLAVTGYSANKLVWYKNLFGVAHAQSVQSYPRFISQPGDTITINAQIYNRESHPATVHAAIQGEQYGVTNTLQLYDDGQHRDSLASDNIWGNIMWWPGLPEDMYSIGISTHDTAVNDTFYLPPTPSFTTIGPVKYDHYEMPQLSSNFFMLRLCLINKGSTGTAVAVSADVTTADTNITNDPGKFYFDPIAPGEVETSRSFAHRIDTQNNPDSIDFFISIFSNDVFFWSDSFTVTLPPNGIEDNEDNVLVEYALKQNYPNPFNPSTTIEFELSFSSDVRIDVYSINGQKIQTLINKKMTAGSHQVEFNAQNLSSGIYFYKIKAGGFQDVKKMVLIK